MTDLREPQTEVGEDASRDPREELAAVRADRAHWRQAFVEIVEDQNPSLRDYIVGLLDVAMGATPTPMTAEERAMIQFALQST